MRFTGRNESAVSPVIGVMLMIVVTIIIATVVSAFAGNFSLGKSAAPKVTLDAQTMYSTVPQEVSASWDTETTVPGQAAVDCNFVPASGDPNSAFCKQLGGMQTGWYYTIGSYSFPTCSLEDYDTSVNTWGMDANTASDPTDGGNYNGAWLSECDYPGSAPTVVTSSGSSGTALANKDGILFTNTGGDALDLKDLELSVRYYDIASTVYYSDTRKYLFSGTPTASANVQIANLQINGDPAAYAFLVNRTGYFYKVNATSPGDTIIRPGDQFMFLVDHEDLKLHSPQDLDPTDWALSSTRADGGGGASIGINTHTGQMEWWLIHAPSGNTLAHGEIEVSAT